MKLTDIEGAEVGYLPLALEAGEESAVVPLRAYPETTTDRLKASSNPDAKVLGRLAGAGAFVDLAVAPLALGGYFGTSVDVEIKVAASADLVGVRRVGQFLGVSSSGAAGWLS